MTIEEIRERCRYWQKVLRLQDWEVSLAIEMIAEALVALDRKAP